MLIEFQLPNLGEGVESADVAEILITEAQTLSADQTVMELETDKAVVELPCPYAGVVRQLLVGEGDTINVGQTLFTIESEHVAPASEETKETKSAPPQRASETPDAVESHETVDVATAPRSIDFLLPSLGEGVESAEVAEIHVAAGDVVVAEQVIMELETDKAVVELPCPHAGTVTALQVSTGDTIQVGQPLLTLAAVAEGSGAAEPQSADPPAAAAVPAASDELSSSQPPTADKNNQPARLSAPARIPEIVDGNEDRRTPIPAAPSTRRLARQLGVNLREVSGSGPGGRITQEDVQEFVKDRLTTGLSAVPSAGDLSFPAGGSLAPPPLPDFSKFGTVDRERMSKLARTAAENLSVSWNVIPHVTQHDRADVTDLEAARKKFAKGAGADGPKVTMTAIVIKALATALQQNPKFNSSLDPETQEIVYKRYYHIGCAVDTPSGLVVPVVKDVDQKSIREVAGEINELAGLARDRKLPLDAMQGATCTVTNLGGIGGVAFTPIVNYPEVCILGLARGQQELRLEEGELTQRLMLPLCLSYDHRVINGADAARFMVSLCNMLSDPFQLLSAI